MGLQFTTTPLAVHLIVVHHTAGIPPGQLGHQTVLDRKVHVANMGPVWGRQDPGGPHVDPMNVAIWGIEYGINKTSHSSVNIGI